MAIGQAKNDTELASILADNTTGDISAQDLRDAIQTLLDRTGGAGCVSVTQFGATADSNGSGASGTNNYAAFVSALAAVDRGGVVIVPGNGTNFYRITGGDIDITDRHLIGVGFPQVHWFSDSRNYKSLFQLKSSNNGEFLTNYANVSRASIKGISCRGPVAYGYMIYDTASSAASSAGAVPRWGDIFTGSTSSAQAWCFHSYEPTVPGGGEGRLFVNNLDPLTAFVTGETISNGRGWSATLNEVGHPGADFWRLFHQNKGGYNPRGAFIRLAGGDFLSVEDCHSIANTFGVALWPVSAAWIENASVVNCKMFYSYEAGFLIRCPRTGANFINECYFGFNEARSTLGYPILYQQMNILGGDYKISGHYWVQTEADGLVRYWVSGTPFNDLIYFQFSGSGGSGAGQIESIVFNRLTAECAGGADARPGYAIGYAKTSGATAAGGELKNLVVQTGGNIFYNVTSAINTAAFTSVSNYFVHFDANGGAPLRTGLYGRDQVLGNLTIVSAATFQVTPVLAHTTAAASAGTGIAVPASAHGFIKIIVSGQDYAIPYFKVN